LCDIHNIPIVKGIVSRDASPPSLGRGKLILFYILCDIQYLYCERDCLTRCIPTILRQRYTHSSLHLVWYIRYPYCKRDCLTRCIPTIPIGMSILTLLYILYDNLYTISLLWKGLSHEMHPHHPQAKLYSYFSTSCTIYTISQLSHEMNIFWRIYEISTFCVSPDGYLRSFCGEKLNIKFLLASMKYLVTLKPLRTCALVEFFPAP
jgi:hypothetical protein